MCGILAALGDTGAESFEAALNRLAHRGPDGAGSTAGAGVRLGHRRLAIVDVQGGAQPIWNEHRTLALVCNGEIYNAPALRRSLSGAHTFRTRSDNEVALHLTEDRGLSGLDDMRGMFSLVVAGPDLFLAVRDPVGIKPLYLARPTNAVWIASEISALHGLPGCEIFPVPPGHAVDGMGRVSPAFPLRLPEPVTRPLDADLRAIRRALERAVESHLMSDVPVGAFLSGGLDSGLITALARRHVGDLHTFATGFPDSEDLMAARRLAAVLGTEHHECLMTDDMILDELPDIVDALESWDRDLIRSAVPCWFVSRLAAGRVKVVLTGEGADELFGGYRYLARWTDPVALHAELLRLLGGLHHLNLQRVDRMTMRHGLEARVPFLDLDVVGTAMAVDPERKLISADRPEKWLLREACADLLPPLFLRRSKLQFDQGAGTTGVLARLARGRADLGTECEHARAAGVTPPRDEEEAWYYGLFRRKLDPARVRSTLGNWNPERLATAGV